MSTCEKVSLPVSTNFPQPPANPTTSIHEEASCPYLLTTRLIRIEPSSKQEVLLCAGLCAGSENPEREKIQLLHLGAKQTHEAIFKEQEIFELVLKGQGGICLPGKGEETAEAQVQRSKADLVQAAAQECDVVSDTLRILGQVIVVVMQPAFSGGPVLKSMCQMND